MAGALSRNDVADRTAPVCPRDMACLFESGCQETKSPDTIRGAAGSNRGQTSRRHRRLIDALLERPIWIEDRSMSAGRRARPWAASGLIDGMLCTARVLSVQAQATSIVIARRRAIDGT